MKKLLSVILTLTLLFSACSVLFGCAEKENSKTSKKKNNTETAIDTIMSDPSDSQITGKSESLSEGFKPSNVSVRDLTDSDKAHYYGFSADLFSKTHEDGDNTLISPLSVFFALAMLTNGADGKTLTELEETLGMTNEEMNLFVKSYMSALPETDYCKMKIANSVWFRDAESFKVNDTFLQTNADYFSADIYKSPFNKSTVSDINNWVNEKTDGMIPGVIDDINESTVMFLINALTFDAEWENQYSEYDVREGEFKSVNGEKQNVEFMYGNEHQYLQDDDSTGFMKYYKGRDYAFAALLPDENVNIDDYIKSLDSDKIDGLLKSKTGEKTVTSIPKFKVEFSTELKKILSDMGIHDAFNSSADLSKLGESSIGNLYVSSAVHKTFIEVDELGTKAGAATSLQVEAESAPSASVILDRPFVYMIIDVKNNLPLFIGNVSSIS